MNACALLYTLRELDGGLLSKLPTQKKMRAVPDDFMIRVPAMQ